jgi:hypothetical protein
MAAVNPPGAGGSLQDVFAAVLESAGLRILRVRRRPRGSVEYDLFDPWRRREFVFTVQLSRLRTLPSGLGIAAFIRAPALRRDPSRTSALVAYEPAQNLYVGWTPPAAARTPLPFALSAPASTLREAQVEGFVRLPSGLLASAAVGAAFRPERVEDFLSLVEFEPGGRAEERSEAPLRGGVHAAEPPAPLPLPFEPPPAPPAFHRIPAGPLEPPTVATGFASVRAPSVPVSSDQALTPGSDYYFWFEVGAEVPDSIELRATQLPDLPAGQRLVVQLFSFPDELELGEETQGQIVLEESRAARVAREAARADVAAEMLGSRLFFPVRTPRREGPARLRCNIYLGSTLVQSRLVSADVGARSHIDLPALRSSLDYAISDTLAREALARVPAHELSLLVNGDGASHEFRFYSDRGTEVFASDASLEAMALDSTIDRARAALKHASWGERSEWREGLSYRYEQADLGRLELDLVDLAREGRQLYAGIASQLAGGRGGRLQLEQLSRATGRVQIATLARGLYVPAGLFYDHVLEVAPAQGQSYRLCPDFLAALAADEPLEALTCFEHGCAHADDPYVVCASGFWGYRHEMGWPTGVGGVPVRSIMCGQAPPGLAIGVSTDPALTLRAAHAQRIAALGDARIAERRAELTPLLTGAPHLVYLFCHGGVTDTGSPFLEIGPEGDQAISTVYLVNEGIHWSAQRPLVFINGCSTTALEPRQILDLVAAFVEEANAIGVVGTELTVFQQLACSFAETMLEVFLDGSASVGAAVRHARLALLKELNPLGLVYVPFVAADTELVRGGI